MKTSESVELFGIMNAIKLTGMSTPAKMTVMENLRILKPISESFMSSIDEARDKLKPDGFDEALEKVKRHNEALEAKQEDGKLTDEKVVEINRLCEQYNKEMTEHVEYLSREEHDFCLKKIKAEDFEKLLSANDIDAGKLAELYNALSEG